MANKMTERLKVLKVYDPSTLVNYMKPYIQYFPSPVTGYRSWRVFMEGKEKRFLVNSQKEKYLILNQAMEFVKEHYPDLEMIKSPYPESYVPKSVLEKRLIELEEFERGETDEI